MPPAKSVYRKFYERHLKSRESLGPAYVDVTTAKDRCYGQVVNASPTSLRLLVQPEGYWRAGENEITAIEEVSPLDLVDIANKQRQHTPKKTLLRALNEWNAT